MSTLCDRLVQVLRPRSWPFAVQVPAVVVLLMLTVSGVLTEAVLNRLSQTQERHLEQLTGAYLDGLSNSVVPHVLRQDVWEIFDTLDRSSGLYKGLDIDWTVVSNDNGLILASNQPNTFASLSPVPSSIVARFSPGHELVLDPAASLAYVQRTLLDQGQRIGAIHAQIRIAALLSERADVLAALLATNAILTLLLATLGYVAVRRMVRPVRLLSRHLQESARGKVQPIPENEAGRADTEIGRLLRRYNALTLAVNEREVLASKLAEEERLASLGRLASGMAHEINNPLGGMLNALDTLKRHGMNEQVRATSLRLIEQGLTGIRELVRSTLVTYRADQALRDLTATDLDDLRLLVYPEAKRRSLGLNWNIEISAPVPVPVLPVRDAALNLLLNACHACPEHGQVTFKAGLAGDILVLDFTDTGPGLPSHIREYIERPDVGSAPLDRTSGLGLWIVKRLCEEMHGRLRVLSSSELGTTIRLTVPWTAREFRDAA